MNYEGREEDGGSKAVRKGGQERMHLHERVCIYKDRDAETVKEREIKRERERERERGLCTHRTWPLSYVDSSHVTHFSVALSTGPRIP